MTVIISLVSLNEMNELTKLYYIVQDNRNNTDIEDSVPFGSVESFFPGPLALYTYSSSIV